MERAVEAAAAVVAVGGGKGGCSVTGLPGSLQTVSRTESPLQPRLLKGIKYDH